MAADWCGPSGYARAPYRSHNRALATVTLTLTRIAHVPEHKIEIVHHGFDLERLDPHNVDAARVRRELGLEGSWCSGDRPAVRAEELRRAPTSVCVGAGRGSRGAARDRRRWGCRPAGGAGPRSRSRRPGPALWPSSRRARGAGGVRCLRPPRDRRVLRDGHCRGHGDGAPGSDTPVGIAPEVIVSGETGPVPSPDPSALARCLQEMLALRSSWPAIGASARRRVEGFTATSMASRYSELYARWLGHRRSRAAPPAEGVTTLR